MKLWCFKRHGGHFHEIWKAAQLTWVDITSLAICCRGQGILAQCTICSSLILLCQFCKKSLILADEMMTTWAPYVIYVLLLRDPGSIHAVLARKSISVIKIKEYVNIVHTFWIYIKLAGGYSYKAIIYVCVWVCVCAYVCVGIKLNNTY